MHIAACAFCQCADEHIRLARCVLISVYNETLPLRAKISREWYQSARCALGWQNPCGGLARVALSVRRVVLTALRALSAQ
jgi:hypothetical protein